MIVIEIPEMHFKVIAGYALRNHKIMKIQERIKIYFRSFSEIIVEFDTAFIKNERYSPSQVAYGYIEVCRKNANQLAKRCRDEHL